MLTKHFVWRDLEKLERDMIGRWHKTRYHPEAPSSMRRTKSQDLFVQPDLPAFRLTVKPVFPTENLYARYLKHLWCFPTVLLRLGVLKPVQITLMTAFPAVSTDSNRSFHPFNYILVHHMQQLHLPFWL